MLPLYSVVAITTKVLLLSLCRYQVIGRENVPRNGSLIIVSNHLSLADPPLLGASIPRRIVFMSKEELFSSSVRVAIRALGAFPVRRGKLDREALRRAMIVLESGQILGIFPEGKRSLDGQMNEAELGAAWIALRSGALINPVGINGTEKVKWTDIVFRRNKIIVAIGQPFSLPKSNDRLTKYQLAHATNLIMGRIAEILPEGYRGVYPQCE